MSNCFINLENSDSFLIGSVIAGREIEIDFRDNLVTGSNSEFGAAFGPRQNSSRTPFPSSAVSLQSLNLEKIYKNKDLKKILWICWITLLQYLQLIVYWKFEKNKISFCRFVIKTVRIYGNFKIKLIICDQFLIKCFVFLELYLESSRSVGESSVTVNVFQRFDCAIGRFDGGGEDEGLLLVDRPVDRHLGRFPVIILIINIIDLFRNF